MADGGIGTALLRKEDRRFVSGSGTYTDDIDRPGQLHAAILRSPYAHAPTIHSARRAAVKQVQSAARQRR